MPQTEAPLEQAIEVAVAEDWARTEDVLLKARNTERRNFMVAALK